MLPETALGSRIFYLPKSDGGITEFGVHVDELLGGGVAVFESKLQALANRLQFGSVEYDNFVHRGRHVVQLRDFLIQVDMGDYVRSLAEQPVRPYRRQHLQAPLNEEEIGQMCARHGALQWLATKCVPRIPQDNGMLQSVAKTRLLSCLS